MECVRCHVNKMMNTDKTGRNTRSFYRVTLKYAKLEMFYLRIEPSKFASSVKDTKIYLREYVRNLFEFSSIHFT